METFVTIERALQIVRKTPIQFTMETISLDQGHNRILSKDLQSKVDDPAFDNSAMDGWAVRSEDTTRVEIGVTTAGQVPSEIGEGEAIRIMPGASIPKGADAIVMVKDGINGKAQTNFIRKRGENVRQGETTLTSGQVMTPAAISLAATMGHNTILVRSRPKVAVISTGDELISPGSCLLYTSPSPRD